MTTTMMQPSAVLLLKNAAANHEYEIVDTYSAGIILFGPEVKSLRLKSGSLRGSYIKIMGQEAFLIHAQISPYKFADNTDYDPKRTRKLLLQKKEIFKLQEFESRKGWAIVPLAIELKGRTIKVSIGVGKGRKQFEKKALLKERDIKRDIEKTLKQKLRRE